MDKKAALTSIGTATGATASAIAATTGGAGLTITTLTGGSTTIASFAIAPAVLTVAAPLAVAGGVAALVWCLKNND